MEAVLLLAALVGAGALARRVSSRLDDEHALAGRLGEPERERVLATHASAVVEEAESWVRLAAFAAALDQAAWTGTPFAARRRSPGWSEWTFADGRTWVVRHPILAPRRMRRAVVSAASPTPAGLAVSAYGPGGGAPSTTLHVTDVRAPAPVA